MATEAQTIPKPGQAPKRRLRNYLLDARFQLKYTGAVVAVTVLVTGALGFVLGREAYEHSIGMTEMLTINRLMENPEAQRTIEEESRAEDEKVLRGIVGGIALLVVVLAIALGLTGIVVTHKVVGPAYKLRLMLGDIERGSLALRGGFRKGDELQELGEAFKRMVIALRDRQAEEIAQLDGAIGKAKEAGVDAQILAELTAVRDRMQEALDKG